MRIQTKQYKYLKRLIGKEVIRIKPCECSYGKDFSYTDEPVRLVSISKDKIVFSDDWYHISKDAEWMAEWLDGNWYSVEDAMRFPKTKLHKLVGKRIRSKTDRGFPVKLICATKYHLVVENVSGNIWWYNSRRANPNNWEEV